MRKNSAPKATGKHHPRKRVYAPNIIHFYGIAIGLIVGGLGVAVFHEQVIARDTPYVLGTSIFLAKGEESSGGIQSDHQESPAQPPPSSINDSSVEPNTLVDCKGPDGKHLQTALQNCLELNKSFRHATVSFTNLKSGKQKSHRIDGSHMRPHPSGAPEHMREPGREIEITADKSKRQLNATDSGDISVEELNKHLRANDIHLAVSDNNQVVLRKNKVEAQTLFPISIEPTSKKFSVSLPSGKKELSVMPDEAVERVLQAGKLSAVENQISTSAQDLTDASSHTTLTELNSKPVFQVKGFSNKKVFGLFPASFAKTVYVSAENGNIVKTDETLPAKLLELISF